MKLSQFLSTLTTTNVQVDLVDLSSAALIATMQANSYSVLEDTIENREVMQWSIVSLTHIKVVIGEAVQDAEPHQ